MTTTRTKLHPGQQILVYNAGLQPYGSHSELEDLVNHLRKMGDNAPDVLVLHDVLNNTQLISAHKSRTAFFLSESEFRARYQHDKPDTKSLVEFLDEKLTAKEKKDYHFSEYLARIEEQRETSKKLYAEVARQIKRLPKKTQALIVPGIHDTCAMVEDSLLKGEDLSLQDKVIHPAGSPEHGIRTVNGVTFAGIGAVGNADTGIAYDLTAYPTRHMDEIIPFFQKAAEADILFLSEPVVEYHDDSIADNKSSSTNAFKMVVNDFFRNEWFLECARRKKAKLVVTPASTKGKERVWGKPEEYSPLVLNAGEVRTPEGEPLHHKPYLITYNGMGVENIWGDFDFSPNNLGAQRQSKLTCYQLPGALFQRGSTDPGKTPTRPGTRIVLPVTPGKGLPVVDAPVVQGAPIAIPESVLKPAKKTTVKVPAPAPAPVPAPAPIADVPAVIPVVDASAEKYVKPPMPKVTLPRKPSKLELEVVDAWQQFAGRIELMSEQRRETMHEILQAIIGKDVPVTHAQRIYNIVGTVLYGADDLTGSATKPASALMDAYAQRLGKTAFAKNNKKEYSILALMAKNLDGVVPLLQHINSRIGELDALHADEIAAKDERIGALETELGDVFANYSKAIRLSRKAEKLFASEPDEARELYEQAYGIAPFRETKKSIAENIAGIFYNAARDGSNKAYDDALKWYKKSWQTPETKAYIADCKSQLGIQPAAQPKNDVTPPVTFEQAPL
jgi:hypothetical protein